ncbi:hypothetical protein VB834_16720 [Limnoraphis robusta Tam1]|uniref:Novel STAND NTPase 1 domain-containing protein n=1 Tax=Limnoraphis robusta CCNP1315 TaxID=3110306 RepID=A0ABU5U700_9CYAN|nr:hypothetical protein [Limnoraphis robusta]MEA5499211.1 hypothetical protein [Limnoraphis robusta BA-68 BA1]MEA5522998.1 hypothetical protein [Limnoraphis robusta CCNP1315]MEA5540668.1 hypothetical protein [Limnoraphis robusta Tam1]MEA5545040.1 hypothetical protein [Limnoraphis robusta CCNP1324]
MNSNPSEHLTIHNQNTLEQLAWAIEMGASEDNFSLIFAYCNSVQLRDRLIQKSKEICSVKIQEVKLKTEDKQLLVVIQAELDTATYQAVMISGFERVESLGELLISANRVREEFRKKFHFPIVFWVNDTVQSQFFRVARDLESWGTGSTLEFEVSTTEWIELIQEVTDTVFSELLEAGAGQYLPEVVHLSSEKIAELQSAKAELESQNFSLNADLEASLAFVLGCAKFGVSEEARQYYERSLQLWEGLYLPQIPLEIKGVNPPQPPLERGEILVRYGCVLFHLGIWWKKYADKPRSDRQNCYSESLTYLRRSLDCFEQAQRPDLVAKFINSLGEVLYFLGNWNALEKLAKQAIKLHKTYPDPIWLAHDYGILRSEVAIARSDWKQVKKLAEQAISILANAELHLPTSLSIRKEINRKWAQSYHLGWYYFSLGMAQRQLGKHEIAISHLEKARQQNNPIYDPYLYLLILAELIYIYQEKKDYLNAFRIKKRQQLIEYQFRFRAFVGAGRISLEIPEVDSHFADEERQQILAQEIEASGRGQNIKELIERISDSQNKLTIIYGSSGVGKSSLVQTGLIPALRQKTIETRTVLPVLQRVYANWIEQLCSRILRTFEELKINHRLKENSPLLKEQLEISIKPIIDQLKGNYESNLFTVLIFDQFEEFFFECKQPNQRKIFYEFLQECLNISSVRVILSLREDYLHYLLECNNRLIGLDVVNSDILSKDVLYYLGDFTKQEAKDVIERLTDQAEFSLEPELIEALVEDLSKERGTILPIELQIVGAQLQTEKITTFRQYQQQGDKGKLIERYLEDLMMNCGEENQQTVWELLLLLTDEKRTRPIKTKSEIKSALKLESGKHEIILSILVESGLILKFQDVSEEHYQLIHDYLVNPIRKMGYDFLLEKKLKNKFEDGIIYGSIIYG